VVHRVDLVEILLAKVDPPPLLAHDFRLDVLLLLRLGGLGHLDGGLPLFPLRLLGPVDRQVEPGSNFLEFHARELGARLLVLDVESPNVQRRRHGRGVGFLSSKVHT